MRCNLCAIRLFPLFASFTWAETVQQALWNVPDGDFSDLSQTFTNRDTLPLSWNSFSSTAYVDTIDNLVNLWVTAFDYSDNPFYALLKENINMTSPGTFSWTIAIPETNLAVSAKYVLRFTLPVTTYDPSSGNLASPGFLVLGAASISTSTIASTSNSTSSPTTLATNVVPVASSSTPGLSTSISSTQVSSATSLSIPDSSTPIVNASIDLSGGAKAGIGIGAAIVVSALVGTGIFAFIRIKRRQAALPPPPPPEYEKGNIHSSVVANSTYPSEVAYTPVVSELSSPGGGIWELPGR